ncbi:TlpA family protein disulfide reductase [Allorhodopirellula solitaria]|uniref:Thiol-disulfide oxidoreductase ResA n=1 Tax=Allorhodopirellula solitaria TaxID=2527987 RepID=A0A5C5WZ97_9BACT|nr:TlpA disulfide reductase family protein [Allorhodopirellula solitaria]TWT56057.1 Thiol-disulfide oxidoreductase ResA [Allorhodopirellula solitaria]
MKQGILFAVLCVILGGVSTQAAEVNRLGLLRLAGGDYMPGRLADSQSDPEGDDSSRRLAWQHPDFAAPFEFDLSAVIAASFPPPQPSQPAPGEFAIEMTQGDRLFGDILDVDAESIRVGTKSYGEVSIERAAVRRITRWDDGGSVLFSGPGPVLDWQVRPALNAWHSGGSQLHTDMVGATAFRDLDLPDSVQIEVELTWEGEPNFALAIGVDAKNSEYGAMSAFRIEVWDDEIALVRELDEVANCVPLAKWKDLNGQLRLTLEIDQNAGRIVALSPHDQMLGEFVMGGEGYPGVRPGIRLTNINGNVSLESLCVKQISGRTDRERAEGHDLVVLDDETSHSGQWTGVVDGAWVLTEGDSQRSLDPQSIRSIELQPQEGTRDRDTAEDSGSTSETPDDGNDQRPLTAQVVTHGGVRLSGEMESSNEGRLTLRNDLMDHPIAIDHATISRISVANPRPPKTESFNFILGRLEFPDGKMSGLLVDTESESDPTPLRFAPRHASAVNFKSTFTGRMVYRESPPPETAKQRHAREQREAAVRRANQRKQNQGGLLNILARAFGNNAENQQRDASPRSMHLRSGEIIPCEVTSIDERGVVFTSDVTERTRLPLDQIRAVAFTAGCRDPEIEAVRRERLLTVPRVRKKNPPTHLIVAVNDDVMRGRLVRVTQDTVEVETRLDTIPIDRAVVAQIIWLDDHSDEDAADLVDEEQNDELAVRALLRNGNRMSLWAGRMEDSVLIGQHPLLGESRIKLGDVDELLIGVDINEADQNQPYGDWLLQDAPEPIVPEDGAGGTAAMSPLVGTEAPDFSLDLLTGGTFTISAARGQVLVLDFWATWCGPCLQAMPVIEEAVSQFDADDVRLVAVNLQETAEPIHEMLDRLQISPEVALDIDGVAAARYQADAIPQTVVIDREGKVTHVFVGGGPKLGEQLRAAISETLGEDQVDAPQQKAP